MKLEALSKLEKISWSDDKWVDSKGNKVTPEPIVYPVELEGSIEKGTFNYERIQEIRKVYKEINAYSKTNSQFSRVLAFYKI